MKLPIIFFLLTTILNSGCTGIFKKDKSQSVTAKSLAGNWQLHDVSGDETSGDFSGDKMLEAAKSKEMIKEGMILSLFEDGTYTEIQGNGDYTTGKWDYDEEKMVLRFNNSARFCTVPVKQEIINDRQAINLSNYFHGQELKFLQIDKPLKDFHEDPFYYKNNVWRIKPGAKETTEQLVERLANYVRQLAYILKAASERKQNVVSFQFSMGIIKIYNGGIGIYPLTIIPKTWMNTYFDETDATSAYYLFKNYLANNSYGGAGIGDWMEDDYNILLSIYGDAKQGKFVSATSGN